MLIRSMQQVSTPDVHYEIYYAVNQWRFFAWQHVHIPAVYFYSHTGQYYILFVLFSFLVQILSTSTSYLALARWYCRMYHVLYVELLIQLVRTLERMSADWCFFALFFLRDDCVIDSLCSLSFFFINPWLYTRRVSLVGDYMYVDIYIERELYMFTNIHTYVCVLRRLYAFYISSIRVNLVSGTSLYLLLASIAGSTSASNLRINENPGLDIQDLLEKPHLARNWNEWSRDGYN